MPESWSVWEVDKSVWAQTFQFDVCLTCVSSKRCVAFEAPCMYLKCCGKIADSLSSTTLSLLGSQLLQMLRPQQMAWGANYKRVWKKKALKKTPQELRNCPTVFIERKALLSALHCIALYGIVCAFLNLVDVDKWQWVATRSGTTLVRPWWSLFPLCRPQSQCHHFWAAAFRWPSYTFHTKEWKLAF